MANTFCNAHISLNFFGLLVTLSKVDKKVVDARISEHINRHRLLPVFKSVYRQYHSTETALVCLHSDMIRTVDQGHIGVLTLLDIQSTTPLLRGCPHEKVRYSR